MTRFTYPFFVWKNHRGLILFCTAFVILIQFLVIWLFTTMDYAPAIRMMLEQLPPQMRMLINEEFISSLSAEGAAAFGLNHPAVLALCALAAIIIPARHIDGEIEAGTMELLLSYPVTRARLIITLTGSVALILLLISAASLAGSAAGLICFHTLTSSLLMRLVMIVINMWVLFLLVAGYTLTISAYARESGRAGTWSAGITLVFYVMYFLSRLSDGLSFLRPLNIFNYYQPQKLMFSEGHFLPDTAFLAGAALLFLSAGLRRFVGRDIP